MEPLNLLGLSHLLIVAMCILGIIYIPKFFINSPETAKTNLAYAIILLILVNQSMDLYFEGYQGGRWKLGLPLGNLGFRFTSVTFHLFLLQYI